MHYFYCPEAKDKEFDLTEEESQHAVKVLRLTAGGKVTVLNGKGTIIQAEIIDPHWKRCKVRVISSRQFSRRKANIHIVVAPTKMNERNEWMVEKMTEIGVEEITFVLCDRSERKEIKVERLERVAVSAMKQSKNPFLPKISDITKFKNLISKDFTNSQKFVAHCEENEKKYLKQEYIPETNAVVLIGPEGDFTVDEINSAQEKGFIPVSLGNSRLRTETAAIIACHTINLLNE